MTEIIPDPVARLIAFAEEQKARIDHEEHGRVPNGDDWDALHQEVTALKQAAPLTLPARGVRRLTANEFSTLTCALICAADRYRENSKTLLNMPGIAGGHALRLVDQFDRQAKEAQALAELISNADVVEVVL